VRKFEYVIHYMKNDLDNVVRDVNKLNQREIPIGG